MDMMIFPKTKKKPKIYKYRNSTMEKILPTLKFEHSTSVTILILNNSQLSVNHSTIPACLDMDLASSKGLHPVQNTATGAPKF